MDWFQIGKGVHQGCIFSPCLLRGDIYAEYIMWHARQDEPQAGIKTAGRNISNLRYADDTTLMAKMQRGTKEPLDESERGEWKSWLKAQHSKTKTMASGPITSWQGGKNGKQWLFSWSPRSLQMVTAAMKLKFAWSPRSLQMVTAAMKLKFACSLKEKLWQT